MIVLFARKGRALLLPLLILLHLSFKAVASEQVNTEQKEIEVNTIGKILIDKRTNEFYFLFMDKDHDAAYPISVKNRKTFEQLKKLNNKWVRMSGYKKWVKETLVELPHYLLKLEIEQLQEFRLGELGALRINDHSKISEIDYRVIDGDKRKSQGQAGIPISDEAANDIITGAGIAIGIVVGPMSLIPIGIFELKSLFLDD